MQAGVSVVAGADIGRRGFGGSSAGARAGTRRLCYMVGNVGTPRQVMLHFIRKKDTRRVNAGANESIKD